MNEATLKKYLLSRPEAIEDYPFGPDAAVYKILDKVFAIVAYDRDILRVNLKCDPVEAQQLRDIYDEVIPGYHMNKQHWNTVILNGSLPRGEIERMIDNSYSLVVKGLKKVARDGLIARHGTTTVFKNK